MSEADDTIRKSTELLMAMNAQMEPYFEAAKGMRARLETDGWSPTAAEAVAMEWLMAIVRKALK